MEFNALFFLNAGLFGVGLAMDAFSVSMANGLNEPKMPLRKTCLIALVFALFQIAMPLIGWICVRTVAETFRSFQKVIPWIALALLGYIGGKMIAEGLHPGGGEKPQALGPGTLLVQGVATSIDALSVGFTIAEYSFRAALIEALIIGAVTFLLCVAGVEIGKRFGVRLAGKASVLGGVILCAIGLEIFLSGIL